MGGMQGCSARGLSQTPTKALSRDFTPCRSPPWRQRWTDLRAKAPTGFGDSSMTCQDKSNDFWIPDDLEFRVSLFHDICICAVSSFVHCLILLGLSSLAIL